MAVDSPAVAAPPAPAVISWIESPEELDRWLGSVSTGQPLALDTEFERVSTFYPIPGLVQLGIGEEFRLVEPAVAEASAEFRRILASPDLPKLLYAMSEDLELFRHWLGVDPRGVVDLQIGAAMAGAGFSLGYARLVETLFDETLDKSATRSDWLARPLSEAQQRYALDDIRFLEPMNRWVLSNLESRGLVEAFHEESARYAAELSQQEDPDRHYLKLRGGWALSPGQQNVLRSLVRWRELECQRRDMPRNRVLADALLILIAERLPSTLRELDNIQGIPGGAVRRYGETLLNLVRDAGAVDNPDLDLIAPPLSRDDQGRFKKLKRVIRNVSEQADIPMELLAPRKRLEKLMQGGDLARDEFFRGWRSDVLAPIQTEIEDILKQ